MSRTLNQETRFMTGEYAKMFDLDVHQSNKHFVKNPYRPGTCKCNDMVCFSLTNGSLSCRPDKARMLIYSTEGGLTAVPVGVHRGPFSSRNIQGTVTAGNSPGDRDDLQPTRRLESNVATQGLRPGAPPILGRWCSEPKPQN